MPYIRNGKVNNRDLFVRIGGKRAIWWNGNNQWIQGKTADLKEQKYNNGFLQSHNDTKVFISRIKSPNFQTITMHFPAPN